MSSWTEHSVCPGLEEYVVLSVLTWSDPIGFGFTLSCLAALASASEYRVND